MNGHIKQVNHGSGNLFMWDNETDAHFFRNAPNTHNTLEHFKLTALLNGTSVVVNEGTFHVPHSDLSWSQALLSNV